MYLVLCLFRFIIRVIKDINIKSLKSRFERLLIPYIIYPSLILIVNNFSILIFGVNRFKRFITFYELLTQILFGSKFIIVFWFLFSLLFFNVFLILLSYLFKSYFLYMIRIFGIISYFLKYFIDFNFFNSYPKFIRFSLRDSLSIFPLCSLGIVIASSNIIAKHKFNLVSEFILGLFILFLFKYKLFTDTDKYYGIENICAALFLFSFFYYLPFDDCDSKVYRFIKQITSYTNGIYCLHTILAYYIRLIFGKKKTLSSCFILYLTSYLISFISTKILGKSKLKYLFL